jgi:predicted ferric reductase
MPMWLPGLASSLLGDQPKAYWYLARASGFVAFVALWLSVALGLIITNKMARLWNGGPTAVEMHQFTTWLAVGLTVFHAFILLGDQYIQSTPSQVLMPFGYINYKPEWVGVGQIAFYLTVVVAASFYFRKRMGYRTWRTLHYTSFVVYLLITLHGVLAGTDSAALMGVYLALGAGIYLLTMHRIFQSIKSEDRRAETAAIRAGAGRLETAATKTPGHQAAPARNAAAPARPVPSVQSGGARPAGPSLAASPVRPPPPARPAPPAGASGE